MEKFVFHVPEWQGELFFSKELLVFVGVILLIIVGTLFCFWGYKYFKTILFLGIGIVACYGSYLLVEPMTPKLVIRMFLTVSLTFLGLCFFYFLDIIFSYILDRLHVRDALGKRTYLLAAPLGAAILGLTIYYFIWRDGITAVVISIVCLMVGLPFQHVKRKKQVRFKTYNDLLRLSRPEVNADGPEHAALGTVAALSAAPAIVAKPVPEPVIETIEAEAEPELVIETIEAEAEPELVIETIEAEAEPELVIETIEAEAEPEPELVIETIEAEPEPELVIETIGPEPESELVIETIEAEAEPELIIETIESEPEPELIVETVESEPESDLLVIKLAPEPRAGSELPAELSDSAKELIHKKMESKEDVLEEAFFVKQISELLKAEKREKAAKEMAAKAAAAAAAAAAAKAAADAAAAAAVAAAVADAAKAAAAADAAADAAAAASAAAKAVLAVTQMNASSESQTDAAFHHHMQITVTSKHDRKPRAHKKRKKRHVKDAAIKDAGKGSYTVGRVSKGGD